MTNIRTCTPSTVKGKETSASTPYPKFHDQKLTAMYPEVLKAELLEGGSTNPPLRQLDSPFPPLGSLAPNITDPEHLVGTSELREIKSFLDYSRRPYSDSENIVIGR